MEDATLFVAGEISMEGIYVRLAAGKSATQSVHALPNLGNAGKENQDAAAFVIGLSDYVADNLCDELCFS